VPANTTTGKGRRGQSGRAMKVKAEVIRPRIRLGDERTHVLLERQASECQDTDAGNPLEMLPVLGQHGVALFKRGGRDKQIAER
jgi:hypothetical protein